MGRPTRKNHAGAWRSAWGCLPVTGTVGRGTHRAALEGWGQQSPGCRNLHGSPPRRVEMQDVQAGRGPHGAAAVAVAGQRNEPRSWSHLCARTVGRGSTGERPKRERCQLLSVLFSPRGRHQAGSGDHLSHVQGLRLFMDLGWGWRRGGYECRERPQPQPSRRPPGGGGWREGAVCGPGHLPCGPVAGPERPHPGSGPQARLLGSQLNQISHYFLTCELGAVPPPPRKAPPWRPE